MGFFDSNGVWRYEETDLAADSTFSATLNKLGESVSDELAAVRDQMEDTGWITPTFEPGWTNSATRPVAFRRKAGIVYFRGEASGTAGATGQPFALPAGLRPAISRIFYSGPVRCFIGTTGAAGAADDTLAGSTIVYFAGFPSFIAEQ